MLIVPVLKFPLLSVTTALLAVSAVPIVPVNVGDAFGARSEPLTVVVPPEVDAEMLLLPVITCAAVVSELMELIPPPPPPPDPVVALDI
jgi:hypothetical protein